LSGFSLKGGNDIDRDINIATRLPINEMSNCNRFKRITMSEKVRENGYTLVEMILVIVIIGILASVAFRSTGNSIDISRTEETRTEMDRLAHAIAGNPELVSGGYRTDFGYVGDIGALPSDWDALVTNPGYAAWKGPYINDDFGLGADYTFKLDAWGIPYSSPSDITFSSTGGPETITRRIAYRLSDLFDNSLALTVTDLDGNPPGDVFCDSVRLELTYPDGAGGMAVDTEYPDPDGLTIFNNVPVGRHNLRMIYLPAADTIRREIVVDSGRDFYCDLQYFGDVW